MNEARTRRLQVVAQDPGVRRRRRIVTARIRLPHEDLAPGPIGHRVHVVDYDASTRTFYEQATLPDDDASEPPTNATVLGDPAFHAQNVYGLVMRTLARFELALGRRVSWGFRAHQLKVVPHAFEEANAFYSREAEALLFGYFRRGTKQVFTCLSHDIVVHETTHALLDGLRSRFMAPSSADQAAFHEGYADIVALLSVFSLGEVLSALIDNAAERTAETAGEGAGTAAGTPGRDPAAEARDGVIHRSAVTAEQLCQSVLFGLADEMEADISGARVNALRRSVAIEPDTGLLGQAEFLEPHRRGEVLVAAVMRAFVDVWTARLTDPRRIAGEYLDRRRVAEEGAAVANQLLTMMIRGLDYTAPIHLRFGDFLSAILTADVEVRDDDSRYHLRDALRTWFAKYGIAPSGSGADGLWERADHQLARGGVRYGSLQSDPTEMFRLVWTNRAALRLDPTAYTRVASVRPCQRVGPDDGLPVRETVAECTQYVAVPAAELDRFGLRKPSGMGAEQTVVLEGGSTLVLDEYGMLKYEINNALPTPDDEGLVKRTQDRLDYLWEQGFFVEAAPSATARLASLHRRRAWEATVPVQEVW